MSLVTVCSIHSGKVIVTVPGETTGREVEFIERNGANVAEVPEEVAYVLLDGIGEKGGYSRPGVIDLTGSDISTKRVVAPPAEEESDMFILTPETFTGLSVSKLEDALATTDDRELIMTLMAMETQSTNRASAIKVLTAKLETL